MKIKTKLTLGVGLLFGMILLMGVVGAKYVNDLKTDTENILVANYNSLQYARAMLMALEDRGESAGRKFEDNLQNQENNITEMGELETTRAIRQQYKLLLGGGNRDSLTQGLKSDLFTIMDMNLRAIERKSAVAQRTAAEAVFWIALSGTFCFLVAFVLLVNLPANIANPIRELTEGIKQIAAKNYAERVNFEGHNEFGELAKSFNAMAEKLEEYNKSNVAKLMMEKQRVETLINNMHDPVIGLDEQLKVVFANEQAVKVLGLKPDSLLHKFAKDIAVHNDLMRNLIGEFVGNEKTGQERAMKIYADGKEAYFEKEMHHISIVPTGEQQARRVGYVIILRNVTAYKELDSAKTNFIATVSHEFKTPIASMQLTLKLLENDKTGELNAAQRQLLQSMQEDIGRLLKITGELLNMTQLESGNIQLSVLPTDLREVVAYALDATRAQAEEKHISVQLDCPEELPLVLADNEKTAWVLTNLLSNAIRYAHEQSVVQVALRQHDSTLTVSVKDSGQGIAPEYKHRIFDRYFRVPGAKKGGTGLGLAISREFMEAQGGSITVESELGVGSVFSLNLPVGGSK